jgi:oligopeptide transport system substrate-binding protein
MRLRRRLLSIVGMMGLAWACSFSALERAWPQGGKAIFNFRLTGDPETLDWNRAHTAMETFLLMNLMDGLVAFDSKLKVVPALAKSWTRSEDGKTYTFKLREDVKWEDGVRLTAKDFVYSWKRLLSPTTAASYAYLLFDIEGAENFNKGTLKDFGQVGIKAPDDFTFQVKLTRSVAHWIQIPTFWVTFPLREDVVQKHGVAWARPGRMVTLGPYTLSSYELDSKVVIKANPNYYAGKVAIDEAVGRIVVDDATALRMFEAGQLDFLTEISGFDISRLKSTPEFRAFPYLKIQYLGLGNELFPTNSAKFRRALAMAIDKRKFPPVLMGGQKEASSFVPPGMLGHSGKLGLPFDPVAARKELAASGIINRAPLKILSRNNDKAKAVAEIVQSELKKNLGLDIKVELFDHKAYRAQMDLFAYPLFEATWGADYPDPDNFLALFKVRSGNNRPKFKSPRYDEQIEVAKGLGSDAPREKIYLALQKELIEEQAALVPLYYDTNVALVSTRVQGIELNPLNYLELRRIKVGAKK